MLERDDDQSRTPSTTSDNHQVKPGLKTSGNDECWGSALGSASSEVKGAVPGSVSLSRNSDPFPDDSKSKHLDHGSSTKQDGSKRETISPARTASTRSESSICTMGSVAKQVETITVPHEFHSPSNTSSCDEAKEEMLMRHLPSEPMKETPSSSRTRTEIPNGLKESLWEAKIESILIDDRKEKSTIPGYLEGLDISSHSTAKTSEMTSVQSVKTNAAPAPITQPVAKMNTDKTKDPLVATKTTTTTQISQPKSESMVIVSSPVVVTTLHPLTPGEQSPQPTRKPPSRAASQCSTKLPPSQASTPVKTKVIKKKKKEKKAALEKLLSKGNVRKVSRHGDEVSIGTMTMQKRSANMQQVLIASPAYIVEDVGTDGKKQRPWEGNPSKKERRKSMKPKKLKSMAVVTEEADVLDELETLKSTEQLFGPETHGNNLRNLLSNMGKIDDERKDDEEGVSQANESRSVPDASSRSNDDPAVTPAEDDLDELINLVQAEAQLEVYYNGVDFECMWDTVEVDALASLEFLARQHVMRKKREKKNNLKQKKTQQDKLVASRLRVFEKKDGESTQRSRRQPTLSAEFLTSVQKLFEEGLTSSGDVSSKETKAAKKRFIAKLARGASVKSLFVPNDDERSISLNDLGKSEDESYQDSSDDSSDMQDRGTRGTSQTSQRGARQGDRQGDIGSGISKVKKSSQSAIDPTLLFEAELKKASKGKFLSVTTLREEMSNRRGTSVNLILKEYNMYRAKIAQMRDLEHVQFGYANDTLQFGTDQGGMFLRHHGSEIIQSSVRDIGLDAGVGAGLLPQTSRWESIDEVSSLDDLNTVRYSPRQTNNGFIGKAQDLAVIAMANLPEVPPLDVTTVTNHLNDIGDTITKQATNAVNAVSAATGRTVPMTPRKEQPSSVNRQSPMNDPSTPGSPGSMSKTMTPRKGPKTPKSVRVQVPALKITPEELPSMKLPSLAELNADDFKFATNFNDMPLTTIAEQNDDDDANVGILGRRSSDYEEEDDDFKVKEHKGSRFKIGKFKSFVPKVPKLPSRQGGYSGGGRKGLLSD